MDTPDPLSIEEFKDALPEKFRKSVNQDLIDKVNETLAHPELFEQYRENLLSYARVMQDGKFKIPDYINAVKYVGFKVMGCTNIEAYTRTFPEKIARFHDEGVTPKDIASYVTAYNKGILVNKLMEQTLIPVHILNQDVFQKAINVQAELMVGAKSEMVRSNAAHSVMTMLKPPDKTRIEMDVKLPENNLVASLHATLQQLAFQQQQLIQGGGATAKQIAHSKIIDVTPVEVEP